MAGSKFSGINNMKTLIIYSFIMFIMIACLSSCNNDSGPTIVNPGNNSNHAPTVPDSASPTNNATNVSNNIVLSWSCIDPDQGDSLKYDVYLSDTNPPGNVVAQNCIPTTVGIGLVDHNTTFYWKVVAKDNHGAVTAGPVWRFRTAP
jgi:hypothetical protein